MSEQRDPTSPAPDASSTAPDFSLVFTPTTEVTAAIRRYEAQLCRTIAATHPTAHTPKEPTT